MEDIRRLPDRFEEIENDPKFRLFPQRVQKEIREDWVKAKYQQSPLYGNRKYLRDLEDEAFANAPEWMKPYRPTPFYKRPEVSVIPGVLKEAGSKALDLPQQIVASYIDNILFGPPPKNILIDPIYKPLERVARWLGPEGEEYRVRLPGGLLSRTLTDPLSFFPALKTVSGLLQRHRELEALSGLVKAIGKKKVMTPSEMKKFSEATRKEMLRDPARVEAEKGVLEDILPKAYKQLSPEQRSIYLEARRLGSPHIPPKELREFAKAIADLQKHEADAAFNILASGDKKRINQLIKWAEKPKTVREELIGEVLFGVKKGGKKTTTTTTKVTPPKTTRDKPEPGDYLKTLQEKPKL